MDTKDTVKRISVKAAMVDIENIQPEDKIAIGDRIVIAGHTGLKDGAKVRILNMPEASQNAKAETTNK